MSGVRQSSTMGLLLLNNFLGDLFLTIKNTDFARYADDNTSYFTGENIDNVFSTLEDTAKVIFKWFRENQMKPNAKRCHLISNCSDLQEIKIDCETIKSSYCEKLLGIKVHKKLNFNAHVESLCKRASQKSACISQHHLLHVCC